MNRINERINTREAKKAKQIKRYGARLKQKQVTENKDKE